MLIKKLFILCLLFYVFCFQNIVKAGDIQARDSGGFIKVHADVPSVPVIEVIGSFPDSNLAGFGWFDFHKTDDVALCTAITSQKLVAVNISNPASMSELDAITIAGAEGIEIDTDNVAYVGSYAANAGAYSVDITDANNLTILDSITADANFSYTVTVALVGDYSFWGNYANGFNKITIVDKTDPCDLQVVGVYEHSTYANRVIYLKKVGSNKLFCSARGSGYFTIFSVSGSTLTPDDSINTELSNPAGFSVSADGSLTAITSRDDDEIVLYDTSDTYNIVYLGKVTTDTGYLNYPMVPYVHSLNYVICTAYSSSSLTVSKISNPASPFMETYATGSNFNGADDLKYNPNDGYFYNSCNSGARLTVTSITNLN